MLIPLNVFCAKHDASPNDLNLIYRYLMPRSREEMGTVGLNYIIVLIQYLLTMFCLNQDASYETTKPSDDYVKWTCSVLA